MTWLLGGIGALTVLLIIWGVAIEPRIVDRVYLDVSLPGLPEAWNGRRIAMIADLQLGMWFDNEGTVRRIVQQIMREDPALVLIGGDFIYHPTEDDSKAEARAEYGAEEAAEARALIEKTTTMLRPLVGAGLPVYAVLGNHDYAMETQSALKLAWVARGLEDALEAIGIKVLRNASVVLAGPADGPAGEGLPLRLVGLDAFYPGEDDVSQAFADLPPEAPRIVLVHNPQTFGKIPAGQAPLCLAGHTHGGQIRIPFLPAWSWVGIVKEREVHTDGWAPHFGQAGNRLYVNRGIGFSKVPIRVNCPPEVTYITLARD